MPFALARDDWAVALSAVALLAVRADCWRLTDLKSYPNTTFAPHSEFGTGIDDLWNLLLQLGTAVFIFVEALLIYAIIRFAPSRARRSRSHVHGNTTLEIMWTVIPAVILASSRCQPLRRSSRRRQSRGDALQVEVYGHQWWWEFRYPQYGVTTATSCTCRSGERSTSRCGRATCCTASGFRSSAGNAT